MNREDAIKRLTDIWMRRGHEEGSARQVASGRVDELEALGLLSFVSAEKNESAGDPFVQKWLHPAFASPSAQQDPDRRRVRENALSEAARISPSNSPAEEVIATARKIEAYILGKENQGAPARTMPGDLKEVTIVGEHMMETYCVQLGRIREALAPIGLKVVPA